MSDVEINIEKISEGVISYMEFLKLFKSVKNDDIISQEFQNNNKFTYIFRQFELDCYIIDKKYFDKFRKDINFNELINLLNPIDEENKKKFKIELKKYLDKNPFTPNGDKIELYSEINEMKELVKNFNNYSFINKKLLNAMGVPESKLEGNIMKISRNGKNTSLLSISHNYILTIEIEKKKENNMNLEKGNKNDNMSKKELNNDEKKEKEKENNEIKKGNNKVYKNLYYLEEITKKIFVLLYFNDQFIQNKLKKNIKDIYNFKRYYLINKKWLKEYKEFFLYDFFEKKIESEYKNKNYSYNRIKQSLNNIVKKYLNQMRLLGETTLSDFIRNANNLKYHNEQRLIHLENNEISDDSKIFENKEKFVIPVKYNLINEDLYKLLIKEEFFYNIDDKIEDIISFDILIGNSQIVIKNKATEENEEKFEYSNEYLIYTLKNKKEENNKKANKDLENKENEDEDEDKFALRYILNYDDDNIFYNDLDKIMKEGLNSYFEYRKLDSDIEINNEILIKDDKDNYIGKFINIDLNKEDIKNNFGIKINEQNKEDLINSIKINSNKMKINLENKETQTIINQNNKNNEDNLIIKNYDIKELNINNEILELSRIYKIEAFPEYQILFVCDNNFQKEKKSIYIGLIYNKDIKDNKLFVIYFYLVKNNAFENEFIVNYYNEEMMFKEIKDNILPNGIEVYLNIMRINYENYNLEKKSLYDIDLNNIGFYINLNNKEINNIKITEYSKVLEYFPNTYFYSGIIQCLVNIKPLREIFLNKQFLINNKFIENSPITKKLYKIFQDKWYWTNNNEIYGSLINDIKNEDSNTFYNCKLLIEFLLLNIHNEQRKENNKNFVKLDSLKYNSEDEMKRDFYENNNTIIQKLFFFETMNYCKCEKCEIGDYVSYRINCVLEFELEINKKEITINDLLDSLSQMKECVICKKKSLQLVTTFSSFPQFLIMVIKNNHKLKDNFKHNDKIQIKNYFNGINEYELVSFIKNPPIKEENKEGVTYCKSPVNNEWYKYEGTKCGKTNINDIINNEKSIPYLLIYKNEYIENIYIKQYCSNSINEEIKSTTNL